MESSPAHAEVSKSTIPVLNRLISVCKDGEYGFATAAEAVRTPACKTLLTAYARQRRHFAAELQAAVLRVGGRPEQAGTIAGRLHREWMDLVAKLFERRDARTVLAECERGDENALRAYDQALRLVFEPEAEAMLRRQRDAVRAVKQSLRSLRTDSY